jgi:hypothetical protein
MLRALFSLHVKNPQQGYFGTDEIANAILGNPSFICATTIQHGMSIFFKFFKFFKIILISNSFKYK